MKTAKELYGEDGRGVSDYQPMLQEFGRIMLQVDDHDYQGDSRVLYSAYDYGKRKTRIGYLNFGWGSCSGCDSLQACGSTEEIQKLMDDLYASIKWFDEESDALAYFKQHDWKGDYGWGHDGARRFVNAAIALFSPRV